MPWLSQYACQIEHDLADAEAVLGRPLAGLRRRLGTEPPQWGDFYEAHFLGMSARAGVLLAHEVPVGGESHRNYDTELMCGETRVACEILTVLPENFWLPPGFDATASGLVAPFVNGYDVTVALKRQPNVGYDEEQLARLTQAVVGAHQRGLRRSTAGTATIFSPTPGVYLVGGHSLVHQVHVDKGAGLFTIMPGLHRKGNPPDFLAGDIRTKVIGKSRQLPAGKPAVIVVCTIDHFRWMDLEQLIHDRENPLFLSQGLEALKGVLWVHIGREPRFGHKVGLGSGLHRSTCWFPRDDSLPRELIEIVRNE